MGTVCVKAMLVSRLLGLLVVGLVRATQDCADCTVTVCDGSFCEYKTVRDILEENEALKEENQWLNDVITNNISALWAAVETGDSLVEEIGDKVATNKKEIALNNDAIDDLIEEVSNLHNHNAAEDNEIATMKINIGKNQGQIIDDQAENNKNFAELNEKVLANTNAAPVVGAIIPWIPRGPDPGNNPVTTLEIPEGWQRCDGSVINNTHSPFFGLNVPDLNGEGYFIRGSDDSNAATFQHDSFRSHGHTATASGSQAEHNHVVATASSNRQENSSQPYPDTRWSWCYETQGSHCADYSSGVRSVAPAVTVSVAVQNTGDEETRPKNMAAVYIMRIF